MNKFKVVQIVPTLSPGGAERVAVHISRGLNRHKYEPVVIALGRRMECDLDRSLDQEGIEVRYLGKPPGFDSRIYYRLHRALKDCRPDIIHTHMQVLRYALPSMLFLKGAFPLHTVHNLAEREIEPAARCVHRYAFRHGVLPVAVAEEVARSVKRLYGIQHCHVISNGIPTEYYARPRIPRSEWRAREGFRNEDVLFVCVARFAPQKNHALLLKAFAEGPASDPDAHLILVGEGELRVRLENQAKNLGLAHRIHFLGLRTDIPDVLGAMDVFVMSSDYEGNPLSVMEAMASSLPVVSTAAGGVPDLLENGKEGLIVQPGDVQGLSSAMGYFSGNREARLSVGLAAARRARERFDVSQMVHAYEGLYEELVGHSHRPDRISVLREPPIPVEFH
ncbi:MAG TPA: glycosyltransferase [Candidatus Acidoferrales bacterium]|nr:glycosyltransferase [Candidatus Acidoferrales bacterium]